MISKEDFPVKWPNLPNSSGVITITWNKDALRYSISEINSDNEIYKESIHENKWNITE